MNETIEIQEVAYHRNGVDGEPFHVVAFTRQDSNQTAPERMVGIVFDSPNCVAVLSIDKLADGVIRFGRNSWRGDVYEEELRKAVEENWKHIDSHNREDHE